MLVPAANEVGPAPAFAYPMVDGSGELRASSLKGHPAVLIFITTYDLASQAQARFLSTFHRRRRDIGAAAIVLEVDDNRPLVVMFRDSLNLRYPVALGDADAIAGKGPFGDVSVPTTIVLDAAGRIVSRRPGIVTDAEIEDALPQARR